MREHTPLTFYFLLYLSPFPTLYKNIFLKKELQINSPDKIILNEILVVFWLPSACRKNTQTHSEWEFVDTF